jgi:hypothetical protein
MDSSRSYLHFHTRPDGRIEVIEYDRPRVRIILRRQIARREGENDLSQGKSNPSEYRCDTCRNLGNGIEMKIEWAD